MKIGIIGMGFVGGAIMNAAISDHQVITIDIDPARGSNDYSLLLECDVVFVCVPSPALPTGECDTRPLREVLAKLDSYKGLIISKTTAPPNVYKELGEQYSNLVHAPEFLTARNAHLDYVHASFAIIGGPTVNTKLAKSIVQKLQSHISYIETGTIEEAALAKYAINSFLATKVVFMNELAQLSAKAGMDYKTVKKMIRLDSRLGFSHMDVPGPDGGMGFGGACFPKDTEALLRYATEQDLNLEVLNAAVKQNTLIRLTSSD